LAIALSFLLVFGIVGVSIAYVAPLIIDQAKQFATNVPIYTTSAQNGINELNRRLDRMRISESVQKQINDRINQFFKRYRRAYHRLCRRRRHRNSHLRAVVDFSADSRFFLSQRRSSVSRRHSARRSGGRLANARRIRACRRQ
jgi:hypothetical protein